MDLRLCEKLSQHIGRIYHLQLTGVAMRVSPLLSKLFQPDFVSVVSWKKIVIDYSIPSLSITIIFQLVLVDFMKYRVSIIHKLGT